MHSAHPIVEQSVRNSVLVKKSKSICYEKLLPYTIKTLQFLAEIAQNGDLTTYKEVSSAIGAGSPQNANWGFGAIDLILGALEKEAKFSGVSFPDITTIVRKTGRLAAGRGVFIRANLVDKSAAEKTAWLERERIRVRSFKRWDEVLAFLSIKPIKNLAPPHTQLESFESRSHLQKGKSLEHQSIQDWIQYQFSSVGIELEGDIECFQQEFLFWSLDRLDVLLKTTNEWIGIEVKPSTATTDEIRKGLYQVIKYRALLSAELLAQGKPHSVRCFLVIGGSLPRLLEQLARRFHICVIEDVARRLY